MYVRITKGSGWYAGKEGCVFKVDSKSNNPMAGDVYYVDKAESMTRRFVLEHEGEEIKLPSYVSVDNDTGLVDVGHGYRLEQRKAVEGDLILVTYFDGEQVAEIREVESLSGVYGDFYMDDDIDGESYFDADDDVYYVLIPTKRLVLDVEEPEPTVEAEFTPFEVFRPNTEPETVDHPSHYTAGKFETIEIIGEVTKGYEDSFVGYCVGNTQKYIARAPYKNNQLEDLRKARKYLDFAITHLEGAAHE